MQLLIFVLIFIMAAASENLPPFKENYKDYYTAAVAEYAPRGNVAHQTAAEILHLNLDEYCLLAKEASMKDADIIVFPEYGLITLDASNMNRTGIRPFLQKLPPLHSRAVSCPQCSIPTDELVFTSLSNCARQHSIYIVANFGESVACVPGQKTPEGDVCPEDAAFQFNTNAVFDRTGRLVARYRKVHLFLEAAFQPPAQPDLVTFITDFGVEFALFTCFDIMFHEPALDIYERNSVFNFIQTTAWIDELPFHTAIQVQEGFARSLNVNLIVSGYHNPSSGQLGSGMYNGSGPIRYTYSPQSGSQLVISQVRTLPSNISGQVPGTEYKGMEEHFFLIEDLSNYTKRLLRQGSEETVEELCHDEFCCSFRYRVKCNGNCTAYQLLAFSGVRYASGIPMFQQACSVALEELEPANIHSGKRDPLIFNTLVISAHFDTRYVYPRGITRKMRLLPYSFRNVPSDNYAQWQSVTNATMEDILAVGMFARVFQRDSTDYYYYETNNITFSNGEKYFFEQRRVN